MFCFSLVILVISSSFAILCFVSSLTSVYVCIFGVHLWEPWTQLQEGKSTSVFSLIALFIPSCYNITIQVEYSPEP